MVYHTNTTEKYGKKKCDFHISVDLVIPLGKGDKMKRFINMKSKAGMEMVQVGILIAIAIAIGLIFKTQITDFVNGTFAGLSSF